jgi:hypothetical protein
MKQVPRDNSVKINADLTINADGIEQIMNLFDEYAVEEALQWNEKLGGKVTVLSIGPEDWKEQIRRALAMGATDSLLLSDPAFTRLDTFGAARVAAAAIRKLGDVDLVVCGRNSTDDETGALPVPAAHSQSRQSRDSHLVGSGSRSQRRRSDPGAEPGEPRATTAASEGRDDRGRERCRESCQTRR